MPNPQSSAGRTPQLYRVQYFYRPGAFIQGTWKDYVPKDLPATEAMELRTEAERLHGGRFEFRIVAGQKPRRNDILHAVVVAGRKAGMPVENAATLSKPALLMAGAYIARATNHGNRLPAPNGTLERDRHGRLVVHIGGAR